MNTGFWNNDQTYSGQSTCPWAARVFLALLEKELPFEEKIVPLANKPQVFKDMYAVEHPDPTERAKVGIRHFLLQYSLFGFLLYLINVF